MASDTIWVTGKESGAASNTITTGIMIESVTITITANMAIATTADTVITTAVGMVTTTTAGMRDSAHRPSRFKQIAHG